MLLSDAKKISWLFLLSGRNIIKSPIFFLILFRHTLEMRTGKMNFMFACSHSCLQNGSSNKSLACILFTYFGNNGQCAEYIKYIYNICKD